jgi:hypothetical protein
MQAMNQYRTEVIVRQLFEDMGKDHSMTITLSEFVSNGSSADLLAPFFPF